MTLWCVWSNLQSSTDLANPRTLPERVTTIVGRGLAFTLRSSHIVHHSYPPTPVTRQVRAGTLLALKRVREPATCEVTKKVPSWSGSG